MDFNEAQRLAGARWKAKQGGDVSGALTLRDYFAAKAMQSMCLTVRREQDAEIIPEAAYRMADAMLKARAA